MAVTDLDVYRAANLLLEQHGTGAWDHATEKALVLDEADDPTGRDVWVRIANAVRELLRADGTRH